MAEPFWGFRATAQPSSWSWASRACLACCLGVAIPADAQDAPSDPSRSDRAVRIRLDQIATLRIHTSGWSEYIEPTGAGGIAGAQACGSVTYTDDNNFVAETPVELAIQAGFGKREIAYASYAIDPSLFPIKLESIEMVFAQNTTVSTVTHWSMLVWDGPPRDGLNVITISSDGGQFEHLEMPAGLSATNIQVVVDPDDPVIIANDSGLNMLTVGFRIDKHNQPSQDPCVLPLNETANAFPTTDVDGISDLDNNWLDAIICENVCDGLNRFFDLPSVCWPSGDWVIRVSFSCTLFGACCDENASCEDDVADTLCRAQGRTFMGADTTCAAITCDTPIGACCLGGFCLNPNPEPLCTSLGNGIYMGNGTDCDTVDCSTGACCMPNGSCFETVQLGCEDFGGVFHGGTDCASFSCPQPLGACCLEGQCFSGQFRDTCESLGTWQGIDSTCVPDPCASAMCPPASLLEAEPPSGTVDARAPHHPNATLPRQGIGSDDEPIILQIGVDGADRACFTLCETVVDSELGTNSIVGLTDLGGGAYALSLHHPIAPGGATTLRYAGHAGAISYIAHPANATADGFSETDDVLFLLAILNGQSNPPHGTYSTDIDHSGTLSSGDILRAIDLLNGSGTYETWGDSSLPLDLCP